MMAFSPKSVFITGCRGGIGLEFVKQLLALPTPPKHIFATCRNMEQAQDLKDLAANHSTVHLKEFDIINYSLLPSVVSWVEGIVGSDGLNLLINNAAIMDRSSLDAFTRDGLMSSFESNAVAPLLISRAFVPLLKKAADSEKEKNFSCSRSGIVNITSRMGSIDDNTSGGFYPYRASKAALNMLTKSLSVDLKKDGILCFVLHPGWVQTKMGGQQAPLQKETSVSKMLSVMASMNESDIGAFKSFDGSTIPW